MLGNKTVGKSYGELLPFVQGRVDAAALDTLDGAAAEEYLGCSAADGVAMVLPYWALTRPIFTDFYRFFGLSW